MELSCPLDTHKGVLSPLGGWALRVARHYPCVGTESEGGFSPGYILLRFQNLTPSSRQLSDWLLWNEPKSRIPHVCRLGKSPYKGGWLEIGPARREELYQNTPNSRLTLRWVHQPSIIYWMWWCCPRMSTFYHGWCLTLKSGYRKGTEMRETTPSRGIMLSLRRECRTKALGGTGESDRLQV